MKRKQLRRGQLEWANTRPRRGTGPRDTVDPNGQPIRGRSRAGVSGEARMINPKRRLRRND